MVPAPSAHGTASPPPSNAAATAPGSPGKQALGKRKRGKSDGKQQQIGGTDGRRASQRVKREHDEQAGLGAAPESAWTEELEQQLVPIAEECSKLAKVLKMLDKHGVATEMLPDEAGVPTLLEALNPASQGFPHSLSTLEFYLDLALASVKSRISSREAKGKSVAIPGFIPSEKQGAQQDVARFSETIKRLLEECKDDAAKRMGKTRRKLAVPKYALHRSLGNLDVFTSAADLSVDDKTISGLRDTDVVAIHPSIPSHKRSIPTLGEVTLRHTASEESSSRLTPRTAPVAFLYYDPYQSFAPTCDSTTATMSYAQSAHLRQSRQTVREWDKKPLPTLPPLPPISKQNIRPPLENDLISSMRDPQLAFFSNPSHLHEEPVTVGDEDVRNYLRQMEDSQVIDERLKENTELIRVLQEAQFARLRRETSGPGPMSSVASREAFKAESDTAQRLLETLTTILNARPRTPASGTYSEALPYPTDASVYKRLKQELVQPDSASYHGVLDKQNAKGIRDFVMTNNAMEVGRQQPSNHGVSVDRKPFLNSSGNSATPSQGKKPQGVKKEKKAKSVTPGTPGHGMNGSGGQR